MDEEGMPNLGTALREGRLVEIDQPSGEEETQGWTTARHIIHERLPLWLVAAGIQTPALPPVDGFADVPAILAMLRALDLSAAIQEDPASRELGQRLAGETHLGPLRAVETALLVVSYAPAEQAKLCEVQIELERVFALCATLAVARHGSVEGFDVGPWEAATRTFAATLG